MNIPGENLSGIYSANEYLTRSNLMKAYRFPEYDTPIKVGKKVAVIGGGNVAMDASAAPCAWARQRSTSSTGGPRWRCPPAGRRGRARHEEGVHLNLLCSPIRIIGNKDGWVEALECVRYELGEPDESGRRSPVKIAGSEFTMPMDTVIMAIGNSPNPLISQTTPDLKTGRHGVLVADPETGATSKQGVYAGGDVVTGAATVISAMGAGKIAAAAIDRYLRGTDQQA